MENQQQIPVFMIASVALIPVAAQLTGLTEKAIRRKIEDGSWLEGFQYHRGPDGHIWVDIRGIARWVRGDAAAA